jgi:hypothetical protein
MYFALFLLGTTTAIRRKIALLYMMELTPKSHHTYVETIWKLMDGSIFLFSTLFFSVFKASWIWLTVFDWLLTIFATFMIYYYLAESPKWLYE